MVSGSSSDLSSTDSNRSDSVTYEILEEGSAQGNPLLVSSDGYEFGLSRANNRWVCTKTTCRASLMQRGESFLQGRHDHNHEPQPGIVIRRKVIAKAKERAVTKIEESAESLAREILATVPNDTPNIPNLRNLTQIITTKRKSFKFSQVQARQQLQ